MKNICVVGKYYSNAGHGAECGIVDALEELGHSVWICDFAAKKMRWPLHPKNGAVPNLILKDLSDCQFDMVLAVGPGVPPEMLKQADGIRLLANSYSVCWNSEPIRLSNYMERFKSQDKLFNAWATFDEGEVGLYMENGALDCFFLPQAFNPKWYFQQDVPQDFDKKTACFIGSIGGKWINRVAMLMRAKSILGDQLTVQTTFNAKTVNRLYNEHHVVLNLGLHFPELGSHNVLESYAFQQRIFEAIGAGTPCLTNFPADIFHTPIQNEMFTQAKNILYYNHNSLEAMLRYIHGNEELVSKVQKGVMAIRDQHTYKARMISLIEQVGI